MLEKGWDILAPIILFLGTYLMLQKVAKSVSEGIGPFLLPSCYCSDAHIMLYNKRLNLSQKRNGTSYPNNICYCRYLANVTEEKLYTLVSAQIAFIPYATEGPPTQATTPSG